MTEDQIKQIAIDEAEQLGLPAPRVEAVEFPRYWVAYLVWRRCQRYELWVFIAKADARDWQAGEEEYIRLRVRFELKENAEQIKKEWWGQVNGEVQ